MAESKWVEALPTKLKIFDDGSVTSKGRKYDEDKPQYGLLPAKALRSTVDVLTFGAKKYDPDNWRKVSDGNRRYFDALQRHLWAWKEGELKDVESGLPHLAHAMCCLMFLLEKDLENDNETL